MADHRHKDIFWDVGSQPNYDGAKLAVLMDIRDELKSLNRLLNCRNFIEIPQLLRAIENNTMRRKRRVK